MANEQDPQEPELARICQIIADAMFKSITLVVVVEINGQRLKIQRTKTGIRFVDAQVGGETFRIMEQNRQKASRYARMARERHQILWVFKNDKYYARFMDGQFTLLKGDKENESTT